MSNFKNIDNMIKSLRGSISDFAPSEQIIEEIVYQEKEEDNKTKENKKESTWKKRVESIFGIKGAKEDKTDQSKNKTKKEQTKKSKEKKTSTKNQKNNTKAKQEKSNDTEKMEKEDMELAMRQLAEILTQDIEEKTTSASKKKEDKAQKRYQKKYATQSGSYKIAKQKEDLFPQHKKTPSQTYHSDSKSDNLREINKKQPIRKFRDIIDEIHQEFDTKLGKHHYNTVSKKRHVASEKNHYIDNEPLSSQKNKHEEKSGSLSHTKSSSNKYSRGLFEKKGHSSIKKATDKGVFVEKEKKERKYELNEREGRAGGKKKVLVKSNTLKIKSNIDKARAYNMFQQSNNIAYKKPTKKDIYEMVYNAKIGLEKEIYFVNLLNKTFAVLTLDKKLKTSLIGVGIFNEEKSFATDFASLHITPFCYKLQEHLILQDVFVYPVTQHGYETNNPLHIFIEAKKIKICKHCIEIIELKLQEKFSIKSLEEFLSLDKNNNKSNSYTL